MSSAQWSSKRILEGKMMRRTKFIRAILVASLLCVPCVAQAHRLWLYPSTTVLSGNAPWVTFDAASSDDLFYFDGSAVPLTGLSVTGPDGAAVKAENLLTGKLRSVFDVQLAQPGTYRMSILNEGLVVSYKLKGENKRWRGSKDDLPNAIPAEAEDVRVTQTYGRVETFVTTGKPNAAAFKTTGVGLELVPVTHPNDLFVGEKAEFRLLLDGKPAAGLKIAVVPGGVRYRNKLNDFELVTDASGAFSVQWQTPGMYWFGTSTEDKLSTHPGAIRRVNYTATVEVFSH